MRTNELLNELEQNTIDSFTQVERAGGTIPQETTLKNLPEAIRSIPEPIPDIPLYGRVGHYPYNMEYSPSGEGVEIISMDQAKFTQFIEVNPPMDPGHIEFQFYCDYDPSTGEPDPSTGIWEYWGDSGESLEISQGEFASTTGITCAPTEGWGYLMVEQDAVPDTTAPLLTSEFTSAEQFAAFDTISGSGMVGEDTVYRSCIKSVVVGSEITAIPNNFMYGANLLDTVDMSGAPVTTIGYSFLWACEAFNQPLDLSRVTSIGSSFLYECHAFNQPLDLSSAQTIGSIFLHNCKSFNSNIALGNISQIPVDFLSGCESFNKPITIPSSATSIGYSFLAECVSFNQDLTIPATIASVGTDFMKYCNSMTKTITFECPATVIASSTRRMMVSAHSITDAAYTTGIHFAGPYAEQWYRALGNISSYDASRNIVGFTNPTNYVVLNSQGILEITTSDVAALCNTVSTMRQKITVAGVTVFKDAFLVVHIESPITTIGDGFCYYMALLGEVSLPNTITSVGEKFIANTAAMTLDMDLSHITEIKNNFLSSCPSVTQLPPLPSHVTRIGDDCLSGASKITSFPAIEVDTTVGRRFLYGCKSLTAPITITGSCTEIGGGFMNYCDNFNNSLTLPTGLTTIQAGFMDGCAKFNTALTLPSTLTTIKGAFMRGCKAFNKRLTLPQSLTLVDEGFMLNVDSFSAGLDVGSLDPSIFTVSNITFSSYDSTAAVYTDGFPIISPNFETFHTLFPDMTSSPIFRKIVEMNN